MFALNLNRISRRALFHINQSDDSYANSDAPGISTNLTMSIARLHSYLNAEKNE